MRIRENIAVAAQKSGRTPESIKLVAVSKTIGAQPINQAIAAGVTCIGENRVQELFEKIDQLMPVEIHLIGALQSNKAKKVVGHVSMIQSIDRISLADAIQETASRQGIIQDVLIQVRIGGEDSKSGIDQSDAAAFAQYLAGLCAIRVCGLMCIPPPAKGDLARRYFAQLRECRDSLIQKMCLPAEALELSMGMSGDYAEAILEGATMIRIGRSLFGERT